MKTLGSCKAPFCTPFLQLLDKPRWLPKSVEKRAAEEFVENLLGHGSHDFLREFV